jgi:hypothetical protein
MIIFFGALLSLAALAGLLLVFRYRSFEPIDRLIIASLPLLDALIGIALFGILKAQPLDLWSDIRLARTFGLYHGFKLYPSADSTGPIIGTLHTPVSHLLFGPAVLAPSPTSAIYVGCLIAVALVLLPLVWLFCFPRFVLPRKFHTALFALTACGFLIITGGSGRAPRFMMIHTDAAAVCFAAIAAGLLCSTRAPLSWRRLLLSAFCGALSLGAKQTMAPLLVALCLFLLAADGLRAALRYLLYIIGSGLAFTAFCFVLFHPLRDFLFNTVILATHRPARGFGFSTFETAFEDSLYAVLPCALGITAFALLWLFRNGSARGVRPLFAEHRWLVFPIVGMLLAPATIKARMTIGGAENHTAIFSFFFFVGACLALHRFMNEDAEPSHSLTAKMLAGLIIAYSIPGTFEKIQSTDALLHNQPNYDATVERYMRHSPETTYFPDAPLATFYSEKRFYDVDLMLLDREDAGRPISAAQFASAIPANPQRVVVPEGLRRSLVLQDYLTGWTEGTDPNLPGMIVYERPKAPTTPSPAQ